MTRTPRPLAAAFLLALGCSPDAQVDDPIGPITDTVDLPVASIPMGLLSADGRPVALPCSATAPCPVLPVPEPSVTCANNRCVLGTFTLRTQNQVVDLSTFSTFQQYAGVLNAVSLRRAQIAFVGLRPGNQLGPLELTWSAESDAAGTSARRLATLPSERISDPPRDLELTLDPAEIQSLARAVLSGTRRFRVRITGPVGLGDGAVPAARVQLSLRLLFHIDTSV